MDAKLSSNRAMKVRKTIEKPPAVRQGPLDRFSSASGAAAGGCFG